MVNWSSRQRRRVSIKQSQRASTQRSSLLSFLLLSSHPLLTTHTLSPSHTFKAIKKSGKQSTYPQGTSKGSFIARKSGHFEQESRESRSLSTHAHIHPTSPQFQFKQPHTPSHNHNQTKWLPQAQRHQQRASPSSLSLDDALSPISPCQSPPRAQAVSNSSRMSSLRQVSSSLANSSPCPTSSR